MSVPLLYHEITDKVVDTDVARDECPQFYFRNVAKAVENQPFSSAFQVADPTAPSTERFILP